jgi:hypothetical protein
MTTTSYIPCSVGYDLFGCLHVDYDLPSAYAATPRGLFEFIRDYAAESPREVAAGLGLSPRTVESYRIGRPVPPVTLWAVHGRCMAGQMPFRLLGPYGPLVQTRDIRSEAVPTRLGDTFTPSETTTGGGVPLLPGMDGGLDVVLASEAETEKILDQAQRRGEGAMNRCTAGHTQDGVEGEKKVRPGMEREAAKYAVGRRGGQANARPAPGGAPATSAAVSAACVSVAAGSVAAAVVSAELAAAHYDAAEGGAAESVARALADDVTAAAAAAQSAPVAAAVSVVSDEDAPAVAPAKRLSKLARAIAASEAAAAAPTAKSAKKASKLVTKKGRSA